MSDRWEEARWELEERRHAAIQSGELLPELNEHAEMESIPFTPSRDPLRVRSMLRAAIGKRGPWTRLTCTARGQRHDTGVELRLQVRNPSGWMIVVRRGDEYRSPTAVVPADSESSAPAPGRWEVRCAGCDATPRRDPDFLDDAMLTALREYLEVRSRGGNMTPRVSWTAT